MQDGRGEGALSAIIACTGFPSQLVVDDGEEDDGRSGVRVSDASVN